MSYQLEPSTAATFKMADSQKLAAPTAEKLLAMYEFMHDKIMVLEEKYERKFTSQKETNELLKKQLYDAQVERDELRKCLAECLGINSIDVTTDEITRKTEWLRVLRRSILDSIEKQVDLEKTASSLSSPNQTASPPRQDSLEIESRIAGTINCSTPLVDYNDTLLILLTIASQKKMTVNHFHKESNNDISECLEKNKFKRSLADPHLYVKTNGESAIYWTRYYQDFLVAATDARMIDEIANFLREFEVKNLGKLSYFQDMQIKRNEDGIFHINQARVIDKLLTQFNLTRVTVSDIPMNTGYLLARADQRPMPTNVKYQELMLWLSDIAMKSRPDIAISVMILSEYKEEPTQSDWREAKRIVRYLKGTADFELRLGPKNGIIGLIGYADANWNKGQPSFSGYVFYLHGSPISWASQKQLSIVNSSNEAECIALEEATRKALWLESLINDLEGEGKKITIMYEDNQKCLNLIDSDEFIKFASDPLDLTLNMKEIQKKELMIFEYCPTTEMLADMLTKPLNKNKLKELAEKTGLVIPKKF